MPQFPFDPFEPEPPRRAAATRAIQVDGETMVEILDAAGQRLALHSADSMDYITRWVLAQFPTVVDRPPLSRMDRVRRQILRGKRAVKRAIYVRLFDDDCYCDGCYL